MAIDTELNQRANSLIHPLPRTRYGFDVSFKDLENQISQLTRDWNLDLNPDFQRGHVWNDSQRRAYMEGIFNNTVTEHQRVIQFNSPTWVETSPPNCDIPDSMQIIDGLQRLTTVRRFLDGQVHPFGMSYEELKQTDFNPDRFSFSFKFAVHTFTKRADLLDFYLKINAGGTVHPQDEIERVRALRDAALEHAPQPTENPRPNG